MNFLHFMEKSFFKNNFKFKIFLLVLLGLAISVPLLVWAGQAVESPAVGYGSDHNSVKGIKSAQAPNWWVVLNNSTKDYFIPTKTNTEMMTFYNNTPTSVVMGRCGDNICQANLGENWHTTCAYDCNEPYYNASSTPTFWDIWTVGRVCGDNICDDNLGETSANCPYDCDTATMGCCMTRTETPPLCRYNTTEANCNAVDNCFWESEGCPWYFDSGCGTCVDYAEEWACNIAWEGTCAGQAQYGRTCFQHPVETTGGCLDEADLCWASQTEASCAAAGATCQWNSSSPNCSRYCGDGHCDDFGNSSGGYSETFNTCPIDCPGGRRYLDTDGEEQIVVDFCGDKNCATDNGESCRNCPQDCGFCGDTCGDKICAGSEGIYAEYYGFTPCYIDCGSKWGTCSGPNNCSTVLTENECHRYYMCTWDPYPRSCGDGTCYSGETCSNCPRDCGACARTGSCNGQPSCASNGDQGACVLAGCTWVPFN